MLAATYKEKPDFFAVHYGVWREPCTDAEGPLLLTDRSSDRQRFLCRFKVSKFAAEVYVVDYFKNISLNAAVPKESYGVEILERGEWIGPEKTGGTYIKYTWKDDEKSKEYARYWLQEKEAPVVVISSMDTISEPGVADFNIAREALLAKRYQLSKRST
jgi:hypothetical protein